MEDLPQMHDSHSQRYHKLEHVVVVGSHMHSCVCARHLLSSCWIWRGIEYCLGKCQSRCVSRLVSAGSAHACVTETVEMNSAMS